MLTVSNLCITVNGKTLLKRVEFNLQPGEIIALTGPSGLGKTTLLRTLNGLIECDGIIRLENKSAEDLGYPRYRGSILLVEQQPVMEDSSVLENLKLPFTFGTFKDKKFPKDHARSLMRKLNLEEVKFDDNAQDLSVGQMQRLSLIRALLIKPEVLLLDEPTSALDEAAADAVERVLNESLGNGLGIIMVTHNPQQAQRMAHRGIDLQKFRADK